MRCKGVIPNNFLNELRVCSENIISWLLLRRVSNSLNFFLRKTFAAEKTFGHFVYDHPQFDQAALRAQETLDTIQGMNGVWFCGAWTGYGFHEDGLQSAVRVCEGLEAASGRVRKAAE